MSTCSHSVRRQLVAAALLLPGILAVGAVLPTISFAPAVTNVGTDAASSSVSRLIEQLGSDHYYLRRRAEQQLIERGADVFDQLQQAEEHPDLEIATRAQYILQQIRIEWIRPGDSLLQNPGHPESGGGNRGKNHGQ